MFSLVYSIYKRTVCNGCIRFSEMLIPICCPTHNRQSQFAFLGLLNIKKLVSVCLSHVDNDEVASLLLHFCQQENTAIHAQVGDSFSVEHPPLVFLKSVNLSRINKDQLRTFRPFSFPALFEHVTIWQFCKLVISPASVKHIVSEKPRRS